MAGRKEGWKAGTLLKQHPFPFGKHPFPLVPLYDPNWAFQGAPALGASRGKAVVWGMRTGEENSTGPKI